MAEAKIEMETELELEKEAEVVIEKATLSKNNVRIDLDASGIINYLQQNKLLFLFF